MTNSKHIRRFGIVIGLAWCLALPATAGETPALPDPTSFALAVEQGDVAGVAAWLADGLDPDFLGDRVGSGLMLAAWEGNIAMMDLFLKHGAHIALTNRHDEQALQLAAWRGHADAVRWLLDHGATPNRPGARWNALHYAAFANRQDIAQLLLERGAEVNARAPNGSTALMMAAREGHAELARQMLAAGADAHAANERGESALTWAMRHEHFSIAQMVSSQAEFARAAKVEASSFGAPVRSVPAPPEIEEILRQIRLAQAAGQPTEALRRSLQASVERFKRDSQRIVIGAPAAQKAAPRGRPSALMITAKRPGATSSKNDGERAELIYRDTVPNAAAATATTGSSLPSAAAPSNTPTTRSEIATILEQMQRAQAAGQPVDALRMTLYEAVARLKNQP